MFGSAPFPRLSPESKGVSSAQVLRLLTDLDHLGNEVHGFMLWRGGAILAESWLSPYEASFPHTCHSLGKSYTSTAVGLCCRDGLLDPDAPLLSYLQEELALFSIRPSPLFERLRLRDVLSMADGMEKMAPFTDTWLEDYLRQEIHYEPGTHFMYNTIGSCLLGYLVEKVTGQSADEFLRKRLFPALGIRNEDFIWLKFLDGTCAEPGISATTEANLRLALLYLCGGKADGKQLLDPQWVQEALQIQSHAPGGGLFDEGTVGYGWQLWIGKNPDQFRFDGGQGQLAIADTRTGAVLALHQAGHDPRGTSQAVLLCEDFLASLGDEVLPENPEQQRLLKEACKRRALTPPKSAPVPEKSDQYLGTYVLEENHLNFWIEVMPVDYEFYHQFYDPSVQDKTRSLSFKREGSVLWMTVNRKSVFKIRLDGVWEAYPTEGLPTPELNQTCASGWWENADTLHLTVRSLNGWSITETVLHFEGPKVTLRMKKDMLHENLPPVRREACGRRVF